MNLQTPLLRVYSFADAYQIGYICVKKFLNHEGNIEIDDDLMKKALKYSKLKTKKEIIHAALTEYVKYQQRLNLVSLRGKVKWVGDLNKMRTYGKWADASNDKDFDNIAKHTSLKIYKPTK